MSMRIDSFPARLRRVALHLLAIIVLSIRSAVSQGLYEDSLSHEVTLPSTGDTLIAFMSDTQAPIFLESLFLRANHNEEATRLILANILASRPRAIIHLGDIVSIGSIPSSWEEFDAFCDTARSLHIPIYPALGNHELMLFPSVGLKRLRERFPWFSETGYMVRVGRVAILILNSNISRLSKEQRRAQKQWLEHTLALLDADSSVCAVILACHHPPFTNSTIVDPSAEVESLFVPLFLRDPKCRLFLSGHSHACEHFRTGGKDFLVIGGGGGLQHALLTGNEQRSKDLFPRNTTTRMFHYLQCKITATQLVLTVRMLRDDMSSFEDAYRFAIPIDVTVR